MNKRFSTMILRLFLGTLGGFLLKEFFFTQSSWWLSIILSTIIILAAYLSEILRSKK